MGIIRVLREVGGCKSRVALLVTVELELLDPTYISAYRFQNG